MIVLKWKDNRGYSLVELIISMAVFSIVAIAILLFVYSGSRSYSFARTELDLQMEAQTLLGQMNTMILEADTAKFDSTKRTLTLYQVDVDKTKSATSDAIIVNKSLKKKTVIYFDTASSSLYLEEYSDDSEPLCTASEDRLFSNYVQKFEVTVKDSKVTVDLRLKNKKRSYQADITTKMRNGLVTYP